MRKVYICSPYRAKDGAELDRNIDYAQQLTRQALEAGLAPITPHLYMTQCMDDKKPEERARGMAAGLALLKGCDFVIAGVKYGITEGMDREIHTANMDDFVILSPDKEQLRNWLARIEQFLREELKLEFNPKTTILAAKNGIDFVGYKHRATHRKVRKDSIKRIKRTIKKCESGKITKEQLQKSIQSWTGHAGHADSYNLRKKIETLAEAAIEKAA